MNGTVWTYMRQGREAPTFAKSAEIMRAARAAAYFVAPRASAFRNWLTRVPDSVIHAGRVSR